MSTQAGRADELRALHAPGQPPLILVNVWDAVSAKVVSAQPGCRAIATASWSIGAAHGAPASATHLSQPTGRGSADNAVS